MVYRNVSLRVSPLILALVSRACTRETSEYGVLDIYITFVVRKLCATET